MANPDVLAIADGVATAFGSLTPPTGYKAITRSTDQPPNSIPTYPFVTVLLTDVDPIIVQGGGAEFDYQFQVRFWYAKHVGDLARDMKALLSWAGILLMAGVVTVNAGLAGSNQVKSALAASMSLFNDTYGSVESYGWEIDLRVIQRDWPLS